MPRSESGYDVSAETLLYVASDQRPVLSVAVVPNPDALPLDKWIMANPGWPSNGPAELQIAGTIGLIFTHDQAGVANPTVYFQHGETVIAVRGALDLYDRPAVIGPNNFLDIINTVAVEASTAVSDGDPN